MNSIFSSPSSNCINIYIHRWLAYVIDGHLWFGRCRSRICWDFLSGYNPPYQPWIHTCMHHTQWSSGSFSAVRSALWHMYIFRCLISLMIEFWYFFPGKWLSPYSIRSLLVQGLVQCIKDGLVMNVNCILEKSSSLFLLLLVFIIFFKCHLITEELVLELFKQFNIQNEDSFIGVILRRLIIIRVHIFEYV